MQRIALLVAGAVALAAAGVAVASVASASSTTSTYTYRAKMTPGAETPKPKAPAAAKGTFTATVTGSGAVRTMKWKLTFSGLSGAAVGAHVHKGRAGVAGAVLVPLCGPCRSGQTGTTRISSGAADLLERGQTYVNVHTAKNQGGEIRGQVKLAGKSEGSSPSSGGGSGGTGGQTTSPTTTDSGGGYGY
jgi:hypothetical protein